MINYLIMQEFKEKLFEMQKKKEEKEKKEKEEKDLILQAKIKKFNESRPIIQYTYYTSLKSPNFRLYNK